MKTILTLTAALIAAFATEPAFAASGCTFDQSWGTPDIAKAQQIVQLSNQERAKAGLPTLQVSVGLTQISMYRALHMSKFGDHSHDGDAAAISSCGFSPQVGANNGSGFASATAMLLSWMNSPEHKHAILNPAVHYIGAGVATGAYGSSYYEFFSIDDDPSFSGDPYAGVRDWPTSNGESNSSGSNRARQGFAPLVATLTVEAGQSRLVNATRFAMLADGTPVKVKIVRVVQPSTGKAVRVGIGSIRYTAAKHARSGLVVVRFQVRASNGKLAWGTLKITVLGS